MRKRGEFPYRDFLLMVFGCFFMTDFKIDFGHDGFLGCHSDDLPKDNKKQS